MSVDESARKDVKSFIVVRHEVEEGTLRYLGEGRLRQTVVIKTYGLPPKIGPVADAVGYDRLVQIYRTDTYCGGVLPVRIYYGRLLRLIPLLSRVPFARQDLANSLRR